MRGYFPETLLMNYVHDGHGSRHHRLIAEECEIDTMFNKSAVIMFGPRFGTYNLWHKGPAHRFDIVGFPHAKLVLEAQATLLCFLQCAVEQLLAGGDDLTASGSSRWNGIMDGGLKMTGDAAAWSKFVQTPFTGPPHFDVDALVTLVRSRVTATGDHLGLLQTEAPYFRRYLRKLYQMQTVETVREKSTATTVLTWELIEDVNIHWLWRCVMLEFEHLQALYHRFRDSITPGEVLPKKIDQALGAIELVLVNAIHERSQQLQAIIIQRPGFRCNYVHHDTTMDAKGIYTTTYRVKEFAADANESNAVIYREQRLWWILLQLQSEPDSHTRFRYAMLLDILDDHLANSTSKERARLDEILYEKLSDYASLLELLWSVRLHCPRNTIRSTAECKGIEDRIFWRVAKTATNAQNPDITGTVKALQAFRNTNAPAGPRNPEWLQQFDRTHEALQHFWRELAYAQQGAYKKNGFSEANIESSMESLQTWSDPEYTARFMQKREQVEAGMHKAKIMENDDVFLPLPNASSSSCELGTTRQVKIKVKTRGLPHAEASEEVAIQEEASAVPIKSIHLSKSSYTTLRYMFPNTIEERQKSVNWAVFVNSMNDAGFTAQNGGGSIVRFESRNGEGSINFHRPHPDPTIDSIMLQAIGWRMNKWFGWVRETFVLARK
jgi:hypothetical protein